MCVRQSSAPKTTSGGGENKKNAARAWVLVPELLRVVLTIYWLAAGVLDSAALYLRQQCRQHHWPEKSDEEIALVVDDAFLAAAGDDIVALGDTANPEDPAAMKTAT